ncbi:unnamed protein product [Hapterophycus canaliculatus]
MAYKDGSMWVSSFDDAGNRCWKNSQTGEMTYNLDGGQVSRRPSNTSTTSPYPIRSPAHGHGHATPWATGPAAMHSPGPAAMHSPGPGPASMHSPGPAVLRSPGPAAMHSPGPAAMHSPGPAGFVAAHMHSPVPHPPGYAANMVPYYQPGQAAGPPDANLAPTAAGQAVGYRSNKHYVMPRSKKPWMWTQG